MRQKKPVLVLVVYLSIYISTFLLVVYLPVLVFVVWVAGVLAGSVDCVHRVAEDLVVLPTTSQTRHNRSKKRTHTYDFVVLPTTSQTRHN